MALQTENLVMIGLGTLGILRRIHCSHRLSMEFICVGPLNRNLVSPGTGFIFFAVPTRRWTIFVSVGQRERSSRSMAVQPPGHSSWPVSSDQNLLLTDDFLPTGAKEFDLQNRRNMRFSIAAD